MSNCKICNKPMVTMSGVLNLTPYQEPYQSGKLEDVDIELDEHLYGEYCEHCNKLDWLMIDKNNQLLERSDAKTEKERQLVTNCGMRGPEGVDENKAIELFDTRTALFIRFSRRFTKILREL